MSLAVCWLFLSAVGAEPSGVPLLAGMSPYKEAKEAEAVFEGVVERNSGTGRLGPPRHFNAYRLTWTDGAGKPTGREVYLPGKAALLAPYVGQRVRLVGKAMDTTADGTTYAELWPARLETLEGRADGILARCYWRPGNELHPEPRCLVFHNGQQLVPYLRLSGGNLDETATALLTQRLNVANIDWKKQMLVSVSAGLAGRDAERLTISRVTVRDRVLIVSYRLEAPAGGASGISYPAETALVERFDGAVRLEAEKTP